MGIIDFVFGKRIQKVVNKQVDAIISKVRNPRAYILNGGGEKYSGGLSGEFHHIDHYATRQNARTSYHDVPQARALIERFADSVVDTGLKPEAVPKWDILQISPEEAEAWGRRASELFDLWAKSKKQHRARQYNFYQSQRLYQIFQQRDNDIFTRLFYSDKSELLNPLQFDFIDPNQIRGYSYTSTQYQWGTEDGIIKNLDGSERAYKVWVQVPGKYEYKDITIPRKSEKTGKIMMLHGFTPEYAGQSRGYSRLAHALQEFHNITNFSLSTIQKAINQASIAMGVQNNQRDPSAPLESIIRRRGAGPITQDTGTEFTIREPESPAVTYEPLPEATFTKPGSVGVFNLQQGDELKLYENKTPSESYQSFIDAFVSYLSASMGMPIEVLLMKFNENYSASRATLILFWRITNIWRDEMAADFLDPVYEAWLSCEITAGRISAPGWSDPRLRAAWLNNHWIGSPMPNIDPIREAKASKEYLTMGATTQKRVARNLNGSNAIENQAINKKMFKDTPVPPWDKKNLVEKSV